MKEVGFPQVGGRLLLKVGPRQGDSAEQEETRGTPDRGKERKTPHYQRAHTNTTGSGVVKGSGPRSRVLGPSDLFAIECKKRECFRVIAVGTGVGLRGPPSCTPPPRAVPTSGASQRSAAHSLAFTGDRKIPNADQCPKQPQRWQPESYPHRAVPILTLR